MAQVAEDQKQETDDPPTSWTTLNIDELYNVLPFNCQVIDIRKKEDYEKSAIWKSKNVYISDAMINDTHSDHQSVIQQLESLFGGAKSLGGIGRKVRKRFVIVSDQKDDIDNESIFKFIHLIFQKIKSSTEKAANYQFNVLSPDSFNDFQAKYPFYCGGEVLYPSCILLNELWLGTGQQANTDDVILNLGITHIVNVSKQIPCKYMNSEQNVEEKGNDENDENADDGDNGDDGNKQNAENKQKIKIEYLYLEIDDKESAASELAKYFESAAEFISNALSEDSNRVLVHCEMGVSRSSSLILAFLMKYKKMTLCDAYSHTKKCRDVIRPNEGFYNQLVEYEKTLNGKSTEEELKRLGLRDIEVDQKAANLKMVLGQAIALNQGNIKRKKKKKKKKKTKTKEKEVISE